MNNEEEKEVLEKLEKAWTLIEIVTESCCKVVGVYNTLLKADDMRSTYDNPNHYVIVPCW